jgi:hypothetical protein
VDCVHKAFSEHNRPLSVKTKDGGRLLALHRLVWLAFAVKIIQQAQVTETCCSKPHSSSLALSNS